MRLIDADEVLKRWGLKFYAMGGDRLGPNGDEISFYVNGLLNEIQNAPTVDTYTEDAVRFRREKTGHWLYRHYNWWCSECGEQPKTMGYVGTADFMFDEFKFCNHCGAKMIGVEKLEFFDRRLNVLEDMEAHNND